MGLEDARDPGHLPLKFPFHPRSQYHAESIVNIREAAESFATSPLSYRPVAIALDTKGPEIRTGILQGVRGGAGRAGSGAGTRGPERTGAIGRGPGGGAWRPDPAW